MSDMETEIRNAVEYLIRQGQTATVASVQAHLLANSELIQAKNITEIPADWIVPIIKSANGPGGQPNTVGAKVLVVGTPFIGTVEGIYPNFEGSDHTAYAVRMPRTALEEGFTDVEMFNEGQVTTILCWYFTCSMAMHQHPAYGQIIRCINRTLPHLYPSMMHQVKEARGSYQSSKDWLEKWPALRDGTINAGLLFTLDESGHIGRGVYTEIVDILKKNLPVYLIAHNGTVYQITSLAGDAFLDGPDWTHFIFVDVTKLTPLEAAAGIATSLQDSPLVECPSCHATIHQDRLLNSEPDGVCDFCANMMVSFGLSNTKNSFYATSAEWFRDKSYEYVSCCIFFRPSVNARVAAYCVAIYQRKTNASYVSVEQDLDTIMLKLKSIGCDAATWTEVSRDNVHRHFIAKDSHALWNQGYGVQREEGTFNPTPALIPDPDEDLDRAIF